MTLIEWTSNEELNVAEIDCQHKSLVDILNEMHKKLGMAEKADELLLLNKLAKELREHFDTEEELMKRYSYVNYFSHKLEHDRYYNKVVQFAQKVKDDEDSISLEFLQSAKRWLFNHLELNDKKCGAYLASKGIK